MWQVGSVLQDQHPSFLREKTWASSFNRLAFVWCKRTGPSAITTDVPGSNMGDERPGCGTSGEGRPLGCLIKLVQSGRQENLHPAMWLMAGSTDQPDSNGWLSQAELWPGLAMIWFSQVAGSSSTGRGSHARSGPGPQWYQGGDRRENAGRRNPDRRHTHRVLRHRRGHR